MGYYYRVEKSRESSIVIDKQTTWRYTMSNALKEIVQNIITDYEEFKGEEVLEQVLYFHLYHAYNLGLTGRQDYYRDKDWWRTLDKDDIYINEQNEVIDFFKKSGE